MSRRFTELAAAGLFAALFAFLLHEALGYRARSAYMPVAATAIGLAMCVLWAIGALRAPAAEAARRVDATRSDLLRFALVVGAGAAYVAGFVWAGFFTATIVMVPALALALGYRRPVSIALTTLGFALILYVVFRLLLAVPLPPEALLTLFQG